MDALSLSPVALTARLRLPSTIFQQRRAMVPGVQPVADLRQRLDKLAQ